MKKQFQQLSLIFLTAFIMSGLIISIWPYKVNLNEEAVNQPIETATLAAYELPDEIRVTQKEVAEALDLNRKVVAVNSPRQMTSLRNMILSSGGEVISEKTAYIVFKLPDNQEVEQEIVAAVGPEAISTDYPVYLSVEAADWGIKKIEADQVWGTTGGAGIKVAVVDTGLDYTHPEFAGRYVGGYDTVNEDADPMDDHGHGTHVSGIIAASLNQSGTIGTAPQGGILAYKALDKDGIGYISDMVEAIDRAISDGARVINFSLGSSYDSSLLRRKVDEAASKGVVLVAAAGNTGGGSLLYPAAYGSVIAVGAVDSNDRLASFSSLGSEVVAPGVSIRAPIPGGSYATWSGTSMASPHVAGTVALMLSQGQANVRQVLRETALDLGTAGVDGYFGYGRIQAKPAVLGQDTLAPVVTFVTPNDGSVLSEPTLIKLKVQDENEIAGVSITANGKTLTQFVQEPYEYIWDFSKLTSGNYELVARASDNFGNVGEAKIEVELKTLTTEEPKSERGKPVKEEKTQPKPTNERPGKIPSVTNVEERFLKPTEGATPEEAIEAESFESNQTEDPAKKPGNSRIAPPGRVKGMSITEPWWVRLADWFMRLN